MTDEIELRYLPGQNAYEVVGAPPEVIRQLLEGMLTGISIDPPVFDVVPVPRPEPERHDLAEACAARVEEERQNRAFDQLLDVLPTLSPHGPDTWQHGAYLAYMRTLEAMTEALKRGGWAHLPR